jgi:molybdenum cofactor cytidylyltransferase
MIAAIILAAGESKRMGQPKMLLPWGDTTVLGHVISTFFRAGVEDVTVVVGGARTEVEKIVERSGARSAFNPGYASGEMLSSLQHGIESLSSQARAALIGLGDQPQIQEGTVRLICETFERTKSRLVVPSLQMRRGHPWLVERSLWNDILELDKRRSPRDFLHRYADEIHYVQVHDLGILADLDTMDDYHRARPQI